MNLTPNQLAAVQRAAYDAEIELRLDYSGRGMYGRTCIGVVGSIRDYTAFILFMEREDPDLADHLVKVVTDSMGLSTIYYWPGIQVTED